MIQHNSHPWPSVEFWDVAYLSVADWHCHNNLGVRCQQDRRVLDMKENKICAVVVVAVFFSSDKIIDHVIYQFIFWSWNDGSGLQVANTILIYILWFPAAFKDHQVSPGHPLIVVKTTNAMAFLLSRRKAALLLFYGAPLLLTLRLATVKFFFATFLYIFFS